MCAYINDIIFTIMLHVNELYVWFMMYIRTLYPMSKIICNGILHRGH